MLKIVFFCIFILFLGIVFSKIKINIEKLELNINKLKFNIKIGVFWFGFIKIFGIKFNENFIKIFGKKFSYEKLFKKSLLEIFKSNFNKKEIKMAEKLNFEVDKANFTLKIGTENMFITVFLVTFLSSAIAELLRRKMEKTNLKKINYKILPEFNKNQIFYEGNTSISIKTINLKKVIINK